MPHHIVGKEDSPSGIPLAEELGTPVDGVGGGPAVSEHGVLAS